MGIEQEHRWIVEYFPLKIGRGSSIIIIYFCAEFLEVQYLLLIPFIREEKRNSLSSLVYEPRVRVGPLGMCKNKLIFECTLISVIIHGYCDHFRFLSDKHRLNVAITRSKMALYVLGHLKSLKVINHNTSITLSL